MFVATLHIRRIDTPTDHGSYDVLAVSESAQTLKESCDADIAFMGVPSLERWKTSGLTGYHKSVTINEYNYFYSIQKVEILL